jgi:hypothetical protein
MAINIERKRGGESNTRYILVGALIIFAFFASYTYAANSRSSAANNPAWAGSNGQYAQAATTGNGGGGGGAGGGGGCCGGGGPQQTVSGSATQSGNVQKVTIDLTTGSYSPNEVTAKAGVPIEITFKGPASGCNGAIVSEALGINGDFSNGGLVKLPALKTGEYQWSCSMQMYFGKIIVK